MSRRPDTVFKQTTFDALEETPRSMMARPGIVRRPRPAKAPPPHLVVRLLRKHAATAWILVPLTAVEVAMDAGLTLSYRFLIDYAIVPKNRHALVTILVVLFAGLVTTTVASLLRDHLASRVVARAIGELRRAVYDHVQRLSLDVVAERGAPDIVGRFSVDVAALETALGSAVPGILLPALSVIVGTVVLFWVVAWPFALFGTLLWPLVLLGPRLIAPRAADAVSRKKDAEVVLFANLQETIDGFKAARLFGLARLLRGRFLETLGGAAREGARAGFLSSLVERSTVLTIFAIQVAAVAVGSLVAFRGDISVGVMIASLTIFWNLGWSLVVLSRAAPTLVTTLGSVRRIDELLDETPDAIPATGGQELPPLRESIALDQVTFAYPGSVVALLGVSLEIKAGQYVAFVGASGSGKSTALSLISRLYDPQDGRVTFDGVNVKDADVGALRRQMAVVMQDSFMFDDTVRENIRLGRPDATDEHVEEAAKAAGIHDDILRMPQGYDTRLGAGTQLSGGQRQRVAIARALVRKPHVLLLDEASSALDPGTEAMVNETLVRAGRGRTTISVTHRLQSVVHADRIFVFNAMRLVESGTHEQLLARGKVYAALWKKQSGVGVSLDGAQAAITVERLREIALLAPLNLTQLERLTKDFVCEVARPGHEVIRQGDKGDLFYFLARGSVSVTVTPPDGPPREVAKLVDGDQFGEMSLLHGAPRSATVTALTECLFLTLTRERFEALVAETPGVREEIEKVADQRAATLRNKPLAATLT